MLFLVYLILFYVSHLPLSNKPLRQVTSNSVRLVSSTTRELRNEWFAPSGYSVNVATANATQV